MTPELETWREQADTTALGWPGWKARGNRYRLVSHDEDLRVQRWFKTFGGHWTEGHHVTDQEVEWAFEGYARRFTEERGWKMRQDGDGHYGYKLGQSIAYVQPHDNYIAALQATVRAAHKEG